MQQIMYIKNALPPLLTGEKNLLPPPPQVGEKSLTPDNAQSVLPNVYIAASLTPL